MLSARAFLLVLSIACVSAKVTLDNLIPVCSAKDPKLNDCVKNSAQKFIPIIAKGVRDLSFPPVDPLVIPQMDIGQDDGPVSLKLELRQTNQTGLSTITVKDVNVDLKSGSMLLNMTIGSFILDGKYKGKGRILVIPVAGDGHCTFVFKNLGFDLRMKTSVVEQKQKKYLNIDKMNVYFTYTDVKVVLTNLFNGNKQLGETTNRFINENSLEVLNSMKSTLNGIYTILYQDILTRFFKSVPYSSLFKDV